MPKIKRKEHKLDVGKDEDIELIAGRFRLYLQNHYSLISLINDILVGVVYILGSVSSLLGWPSEYGTYFYLAGGVFLILRPLLKVFRNIYIYSDAKEVEEEERKPREEEGKENQDEKDDQDYNEEYYGDDKNEEYEKDDNS